MDPKEWDYNEVLSMIAKQMGVELDEDDFEEESEMKFVGVKSADIYSGGRKLPNNTTRIYCNGPIGDIDIDFNHDQCKVFIKSQND